ncbi:O-antigen ligase [Burkholderia sp. Bp8963]|uniref:O-antigen ligase family protein n=1 Tax=Burkholderia sp. Bp8963 TaxID=2184547 RepID=UPI00163B0632|nr:O-antigen ligase family protein [Burkholderia sp. Bp8963]
MLIAFIGGSCYGTKNSIAEAMLVLPSAILAALAVLFTVVRSSKADTAMGRTVIIGVAIACFGLVGALFQSDAQSAVFAVIFLVTWLSIAACAGALEIADVTKSFAMSGAIVMLGFVAIDHANISTSLSVTGVGKDILSRYMGPFGAHPNLMGHIAGCYLVAMFWQARDERFVVKIILWAGMVASALICVAASSRGGLFAAIGACVLVYAYEKSKTLKGALGLVVMATAAIVATILFYPNVLERMDVLLDLSNSQRGLNSGLSGRTQMWQVVLDQFGTANEPFVWGAGFRSTWLTKLTDAIDNGYLMIAAEIGVIGLALWLYQVFRSLRGAYMASRATGSTVNLMILSIVIFFLAESIVARYFLALGNGASVFFMMLIILIPSEFKFRHVINVAHAKSEHQAPRSSATKLHELDQDRSRSTRLDDTQPASPSLGCEPL